MLGLSGDNLKIETVKTSIGEASYCAPRGGIITSLKLNGKEVLYLDEETFVSTNQNVRGGIPILFPNAGALESPQYLKLSQHGFARNSKNWTSENMVNGFRENLVSDENSLEFYPYDFSLTIQGSFEENGSFTIIQKVANMSKEKDLPVSMGLHPYFRVSKEEKKNIQFNFEGGDFIKQKEEDWINGEYISIDNPKLKDPKCYHGNRYT